MNIGQAAEATGLTAKAIRHYESLGLVVPDRQAGNDYRHYSLQDVDDLRFLQRARTVGFSLDEAGQLLDFYRNPKRNSAEVHALVMEKLSRLDQQWLTLNLMRQTLTEMAAECTANESSDCAIINHLAEKPVVNIMPFTLVEVSDE
jgi:MerR family transcriptional regulator, copper efflux regulator